VAKTFMVSVASVVKWSQRHRAVGSPAALKMGGKRPYLVARERDWVLARIAEKPDLTLRELCSRSWPTAAWWSVIPKALLADS
jgi:transposase